MESPVILGSAEIACYTISKTEKEVAELTFYGVSLESATGANFVVYFNNEE
jgi:hypothetical protein